jgi:N-acetylglutamate synthase/N-acetylornithine aminotransferase
MDKVAVAYGGTDVCRDGVAVPYDEGAVAAHMDGKIVDIQCRLGLGDGVGVAMTVDLGYGYIDENRKTS